MIEYGYHQSFASSADVLAKDGQRLVASLNIFGIGYTPVIDGIHVEPCYRRQGIATAMWQLAREHCPDLQHSQECTPVGYAWARSVGGYVPSVTIVDPGRYLYDDVLLDVDGPRYAVGQEVIGSRARLSYDWSC